ncbi:MAG TPA: ribosome biogenesis GTP-binding protein YihA/YsxC [Hypericibacter adhaerens]|jgi:GTP-binding protein|uniref:ribosome biogenesis GTP-binding protein YihA/YsxC n=1 Tax=Hypericibacter adhaerens TaxID=2602016 RepID=UPI002C264D8C|nr:ribosome biogenesis GTP-binding protein YihA/YsxC [Hypericibacter adhaerens]HWA41787.1 ribosome biogenesis GTP-binding protein YihA/YsxC [Hypericibacter adhaerens]
MDAPAGGERRQAMAEEIDPAAIEAGRLLFAAPCEFVAGVTSPSILPPVGLPEVAFAGRSNVGKSSLINALTGRKTLARTSNTPGRTQQLNFFDLGGRLMLVDMPGYGYAKASRKDVKEWQGLATLYLKGRPSLRRALLLVDARQGLKEIDERVMKQLDESAQSYQIVLTKADKLKPEALAALRAEIAARAARHPAAHPEIVATSSVSGEGIPLLRALLAALASPAPLR